jgi:hypothetical protein
MMRTLLTLSLLALSLPTALVAGPEVEPLRFIAIQEGGRNKPLDTFARETARRVVGAKPFGFESVSKLEPTEWVLAMLATPDRWREEPILRVTHAGLREAAGLPADKDLYTFNELVSHEGFLDAVRDVHAKLRADEEIDPVERELADLYDTLSVMSGIMSGEALRIIPASEDPKASWFTIADLSKPEVPQVQRVRTLLTALVSAYAAGDMPGVQTASAGLASRLASIAPGVYPSERDLAMEVHYNRSKPFRTAWILYLLGFLALIASFPLASKAVARTGMALVVGGFLFNGYGMLLRTLISGRPPVTNMYETVVFVAWGGVLFALIFEWVYKARYFAATAAGLGVLCLILADNVPILDGAIAPLVPVLRDNMWLTVHVLTIMLGYAAFTLAMGLGHPGGDPLPGRGHPPRRGVGLLLVGPVLGLGSQGDLGPHRAARLPGHPPRPLRGVDQGLRPRGGLDHRLPAGAHGLVRRELRAGHRAPLLRLRLRRLHLHRRLRAVRAGGDRRGPGAAAHGDAEAGDAPARELRT